MTQLTLRKKKKYLEDLKQGNAAQEEEIFGRFEAR